MIAVPLSSVLLCSPSADTRRGTLQHLQGRLQLAPVVAVDTRSLLQRRWDWLETQNIPDDVMGWLDYIFERTTRNLLAGPEHQMWNVLGDRPEIGRLMVWFAKMATEHGIPYAEDLWDFNMHETVTGRTYGDIEDLGVDLAPDELYEAAWEQSYEDVFNAPWDMVGISAAYRNAPGWYRQLHADLSDDDGRLRKIATVVWEVGEKSPLLTETFEVETADGPLSVLISITDGSAFITDLSYAVFLAEVSGPGSRALDGRIARLENSGDWRSLVDELLWFDSMDNNLDSDSEAMLVVRDKLRLMTALWIERVVMMAQPMRQAISMIRDHLRARPDAMMEAQRFQSPIHALINHAVATHQEAFLEDEREDEEEDIEDAELGEDFTTLRAFSDGASIVEVLTTLGMRHEGRGMNHCIGTERWGHPRLLREGKVRVFSYRDPTGRSQATWEARVDPTLPTEDVQGPGNGSIRDEQAHDRLSIFMHRIRQRHEGLEEPFWWNQSSADSRPGRLFGGNDEMALGWFSDYGRDLVSEALGGDEPETEWPDPFERLWHWEHDGDGLVGYKVMRFDPESGRVVSGANSRIDLAIEPGSLHRMPGPGIFLAPSAEYCLDHYAGHEMNVLLRYRFDPDTVTSGSLTDREPEITVPEAALLSVSFYDEDLDRVEDPR